MAPDPDSVWEDAHTDYGPHRRLRAAPSGLAVSDIEWCSHLQETPNGWLLHAGCLLETLVSGQPIYLMHTTTYLEAIRASGQLYQAAGCLVGALYCAPLTREPTGLRPHNLGSWLLETKPRARTIVFEVTPGRPVPAKGIDYLRLGGVHLRTYMDHRAFLTAAEDDQLCRAAVERVRRAAGFLDVLLAGACGTYTPEAQFLDQLAAAVPIVPFLGYLYFEVVAEYLMLHSISPQTKAYAQVGEMNNRLYKQLAFAAVDTMGHLFDLALFRPAHDRLRDLIWQIETGLVAGAADYIRRRLSHLFACVALAPSQDAASVSFRDATFDALAQTAPGLLGQMVFRQLRTSLRYPQLFPIFEQAKATAASAYWNTHGIPTPFNGVTPKGEIGLNLAWPTGARAWVAEACQQGLLHPTGELTLTFVPRLADLRETALGRARFAVTAAPSSIPPSAPNNC
ncbi:hypothetical protein NE235_03245 [Actinoallomurus spadix]|uniref:Uncharacterized protein n=1 Tax=Actinoallomurus spadix TaxID=79912 RepID=A0ABN0XLI3_9ACTN|nr:hypothetical protein [Actinoallomurus spadix]MCO5985121.1 hypothetical protein [Actinoallomurus spadix]